MGEVRLMVDSVLINNAGILDQRPFIMSTIEGFWRQIEVNFKGVILTCDALFTYLNHSLTVIALNNDSYIAPTFP